jgi:hypothetical protein
MAAKDFPIDLIEKLFDAKIALVTNEIKNVQVGVDNINKVLNGNGKPGLVNRVGVLETRERVRAGQFALLAGIGSILLYFTDKLIAPALSKILNFK